nr:uncharacterized protein I303_06478 [Kwoniella dejecticola CBS 10117]OBR82920.1 hypothetical protein I303_06478 [Kwoniella dejecticola CBS 10117]
MSRCIIIKDVSDTLDRPPSVIAKASILFYLSIIALNPSDLSGSLTNALGFIPAAYHTLTDLQEGDQPSQKPGLRKKENQLRREKTRRWLDYWVVYCTSCMLGSVLEDDLLLSIMPIWYIVKSVCVIWFLVGLLDNEEMEGVRPKPLRLRPRSIIASRDPHPPGSSSDSGSDETPSPLSAEYQNESDYTSGTDDEIEPYSSTSNSSSRSVSPAKYPPEKLRTIQKELRETASPALSITPVNYRNGTLVTPLTGLTSGIEDEDTESTTDKSQSSDSSPGSRGIDGESEDSDTGSDVVTLPPDTPLDELALRGKKTIELTSPSPSDTDSSDIPDVGESGKDDPPVAGRNEQKVSELIKSDEMKAENNETVVELEKDPAHGEDAAASVRTSLLRPKAKEKANTADEVQKEDPNSQEGGTHGNKETEEDIHILARQKVVPAEMTAPEGPSLARQDIPINKQQDATQKEQILVTQSTVERQGQGDHSDVVKLSMEDLLAMDAEEKRAVAKQEGGLKGQDKQESALP